MYFDSKIKGKHGWFDGRSKWQKSSDEYFERLEELALQIDDLEACTSFITSLSPDDFDSGYRFLLNRVRELKHYLVNESDDTDRDELLDSLEELKDSIMILNDDALLYEIVWDDDEDDDEDDFDFDLDDDEDEDDDDCDW